MERLKKRKMRSKCSYTKNRNKLMMVMEGGLSSKMQVMESLIVLTDAYESVLRACKEVEAYYENIRDSRKLGAVSMELDAIEKDFSEVEGIVKGYLSGTSRSSADDQTKRLREEITKQEEELMQVKEEIEQTVAEYGSNFHRTLKTRNKRQDQTKERKQLALVN